MAIQLAQKAPILAMTLGPQSKPVMAIFLS
jgi:hypothetical protein